MEKIAIVIPLAPHIEINPVKQLNVKESIPTIIVKGKNTSRNRNIGIKKTKTDFVAFINGHTILSDNWQEQVEKFFSKHPEIDIVGGPQLNYKGDNFFAKSSGFALSSLFGGPGAMKRYGGKKINLNADETSITSANLICRKRVFKKVKFDEKLYPGEDPKFISDSIKAGFKVAYSPDIIAYNKRRGDPFSLAKQMFGYGKTRPEKESLLETFKHPSFLAPPTFILYLALLPVLYLFSTLFTIPLWLYFALDIVFPIYEGFKNKSIKSITLLPLIFPIIHISYGLGFLYGTLVKK